MFNPIEIALHTVAIIQDHYRSIAMQLYFMGSNDDLVAPLEDSPIRQRINLLVAVANGETHHEGIVAEALQSVQDVLSHIPVYKWHKDMQSVMILCEGFVRADTLITITEASILLRGVANPTTIRAVNYQIEAGKLASVIDPNEPNPTRNRRVWRADVLKLKADKPKDQ